jgi:histidinol phosphatase-like PHP family hydrolase
MSERGQHRDLRDVPEADHRIADRALTPRRRHQELARERLDLERDDLRGTLPPLLRASLRPIAIACLRLVTRRPELLFRVPLFRRCIADFTRRCALLPYLAMCNLGRLDCKDHDRSQLDRSMIAHDINATAAGFLRDLAMVQSSRPKMFGYKRAAAAVSSLERPLTSLVGPGGTLAKIPGIGPASTRVIVDVLERGSSPTVEAAVAASGQAAEIDRRRRLRTNFLSRAMVLHVLDDLAVPAVERADYRGDFQMHSEWSDGVATLAALANACRKRDYSHAAVTDHSHGLKIAGGMSMSEAAAQRATIARLNSEFGTTFRLIQGIEANIGNDGSLDLSDDEAAQFDLVLAAPHSQLRTGTDQTARLLAAVRNPRVHILAHPRGRLTGSRAGVVADWTAVFRAAADEGVVIEIDGDPARQDLDFTLAKEAFEAGCTFALDSDAHTTGQLVYAETAIAHARLASIPASRIVNCWPLDRLLAWLADRSMCESLSRSDAPAPRQAP